MVVESGEVDIRSFLSDIASSFGPDGIDLTRMFRIMDVLIAALVLYWTSTYGKPIVATSFTEEGAYLQLRSKYYYSYPSPHRAVKVLSKLAEYRESLDGTETSEYCGAAGHSR